MLSAHNIDNTQRNGREQPPGETFSQEETIDFLQSIGISLAFGIWNKLIYKDMGDLGLGWTGLGLGLALGL